MERPKPDKLLRLDGVARMDSGRMYLYGRTLLDMMKLLGITATRDSDDLTIMHSEMYRVDSDGIHVA